MVLSKTSLNKFRVLVKFHSFDPSKSEIMGGHYKGFSLHVFYSRGSIYGIKQLLQIAEVFVLIFIYNKSKLYIIPGPPIRTTLSAYLSGPYYFSPG